MEAMRRKIIEEQLAAIEQAKRQQQERQQSTTASSSSSSSAANPAVTLLPHRNKHAPPPKVKLFQPPLMPYVPPKQSQSQSQSQSVAAFGGAGSGAGSRTDPIVFGESSPIGATSRSNPFQSAAVKPSTSASSSSRAPARPPASAATSSYAAAQPFRSPNSKSSHAPFISPSNTPPPPPLRNNNPFYHSPLASPSASRSNPLRQPYAYDDHMQSSPVHTIYPDDTAIGPTIDAATRERQIRDLLSNMVNVTQVSDDAKTDAHVPGLKCMLIPHQVQGVAWMREREKGAAKGGILADDMGLGKTVQTLALIVSNRPGNDKATIDLDVPAEPTKRGKKAAAPKNASLDDAQDELEDAARKEMPSKTTLIIAPLAVIKQWEREVTEKTDAGLKVYLYHGPSRTKSAAHFAKFDIVISTYTTVASEYNTYMAALEARAKGVPLTKPAAKSKSRTGAKSNAPRTTADSDADSGSDVSVVAIDSDDTDDSFARAPAKPGKPAKKAAAAPLFDFSWLRIVLDEAQNIKNHKAKCSRACFMLAGRAVSRWCLTGTPLQNDAYEMFSLIHFLRVPPFDDYAHFREKIGEPLKSANQNRVNWGMKRLCFVLQTIMLRRTKDAKAQDGSPILTLPKRTLQLIELDFDSDAERQFYLGLQERIRKAFEAENGGQGKTNMIASLVLLLRLRQACNHPAMVTGNLRTDAGAIGSAAEPAPGKPAPSTMEAEEDDDDGLAAMLSGLSVAVKRCEQCQVDLPPGATPSTLDAARRLLCAECAQLAASHSHDLFAASTGSTKIRKMLSLLTSIRAADAREKTIVFSQFTSFLDLVEPHLSQRGFGYVRYDGSMRPPEREAALERIRSDAATTVILISFKAGSTGLNLTACSRVILMDLWWNPQIEEQAFDRAHRLGQVRDVTIYKLSIKDTVEERILRLQDKKRALAKAALEGSKLVKGNRLDFKEIWFLFNGND